jgi:tripartite-type tricarboxylate transporter receptor subunit TctC
MSIDRRYFVHLMAGVASTALVSGRAAAEGYPSRAVRTIVPFGAGGPPDVIARMATQKWSEDLGQRFYVDNLPGAGGNSGTGTAARAKPDGYTLLTMSTGFLINPILYAQVPYDPIKDFAPISLIASSPNALVVNPQVPAKTLTELVNLVKANPGKYSYAHPGTGSSSNLSGELLKLRYGLDLAAVPYNSGPEAVISVIGGHTPIGFIALPAAVPNAQDGKVRAIAVTSAKRSPTLPDIPTMTESGAIDQEAESLNGVLAPIGTPSEIIDRLYREVASMLAQADIAQHLRALGFEPVSTTPEQFSVRIKFEIERWSSVIREANIKLE